MDQLSADDGAAEATISFLATLLLTEEAALTLGGVK
jgi:hypothetical protein